MNRFEVKYLIDTRRVPELVSEIGSYVQPDRHSSDQGYSISSVYWDTADFAFFWEKVEGARFRRKLRFRRYGGSPDIFVEIKQRDDRTVQKRRIQWPEDRVATVFGDGRGRVDWGAASADPVASEVAVMIERYGLRPRMAIRYRRRAFFGAFDPELRVTFDGRIRYHPADFSLTRPFEEGRDIVDPRVTVLEVKYDHRAPLWLTKAAIRHRLQMVRMSKYCSAVDRHYFGGANT